MTTARKPSKTKPTARASSQKENRLQPTGAPGSGFVKESAMEVDQDDNQARKDKQVSLETSELFLALLMSPILSLIPILSPRVPNLSRLYRSLNQMIVTRSLLIVERDVCRSLRLSHLPNLLLTLLSSRPPLLPFLLPQIRPRTLLRSLHLLTPFHSLLSVLLHLNASWTRPIKKASPPRKESAAERRKKVIKKERRSIVRITGI
jgi:hypothetical protein